MVWAWLYESWLEEVESQHKLKEDYAILTGSFANPAMAQRIYKSRNPDHEVSDEEWEKNSQEMVLKNKEEIESQTVGMTRRKKRKFLQERGLIG